MHARLDDHAAQRFDAAADRAGGRSVLLRRLMMHALDAGKEEMAGPVRRREQATRRVEIRLTEAAVALAGTGKTEDIGLSVEIAHLLATIPPAVSRCLGRALEISRTGHLL